jgi:acyl-homoserine-lactone acylase
LYTHPDVAPRVITRFEPWMALTFSEGSIGGDIERVSLGRLEDFYGLASDGRTASLDRDFEAEPSGSNGFAIAPSNSATGNALLLINPHTSFFFRSELHMVSEEGLNAYGAVTWGQFFVYQGFNEGSGWMHTSSGVDNIDEYLETVIERDGQYFYEYGGEERPVTEREITVPYKTDTGMAERQFTVYRTHHGPIVRQEDDKWVSVSLMEAPMDALNQSYSRTKARNYEEYYETMELHTNSSNNTVFADAEGNIAYFHSNFIPIRDTAFDWLRPVDGSDPATEWQGVHPIDEAPNVLNPPNGWIQNTNNWPFSAAGANSPRRADYPIYVQRSGENARGLHAIRVLDGKTDFDIQSLIDAAYDSYLTAFEESIPALLRSYDQTPASNPLKARLSEQIELLRDWDLRYTVESIATSLAIFWGTEMRGQGGGPSATQQLQALADASDKLEADFGSWRTPWGDINRFQRLTGDIAQPFDDAGPSFPVEFASSRWGSLASFGARAYPQTKKWYGTSGNSFVAVVEFGDRVRARAITAGGLNSDPSSPHFNDQTERYATGNLRDVYYYPEDLEGHIEREYHPGG